MKKLRNDSFSEIHNPLKKLLPIRLLKPVPGNNKTLFTIVKTRKTCREISDRKLTLQMLSDLLWTAWGINRKQGPFGLPGRTAASASNSQEIDIYVLLQEGVYFFNAIHNRLDPVIAGDLRKFAVGKGQEEFVSHTPVNLIYVADIDRLIHTHGYREPGLLDPEIQKAYYYVDTGLIASNVYLFAASRGLAAWFHNCDRKSLQSKLKLQPEQRVLFGQTVGYRKT